MQQTRPARLRRTLRGAQPLVFVLFVLISPGVPPAHVHAQAVPGPEPEGIFWAGGSGLFGSGDSWVEGVVPTINDIAVFASGGGQTIQFNDDQMANRLVFRDGVYNFELYTLTIIGTGVGLEPRKFHVVTGEASPPSTVIGEQQGEATMLLSAGTLTGFHAAIGRDEGSSGEVQMTAGPGPLDPATWQLTGSLAIGGSRSEAGGEGTLTLEAGQLELGNELRIWEQGELTQSGGTLVAEAMHVTGGSATISGGVADIGGELDTDLASVMVAGGEQAGLHVTQGGSVEITTGDVRLGGMDTLGVASVIGPGSTLNVQDSFTVGGLLGSRTRSTMNVLDGGSLRTGEAEIGGLNEGRVALEGEDTYWRTSFDPLGDKAPIAIGGRLGARLDILDGALLHTGEATIGTGAAGGNEAQVIGEGSYWRIGQDGIRSEANESRGALVPETLVIGQSAGSSLTIRDGGRVDSGGAVIGEEPGKLAISSVTVEGQGSRWRLLPDPKAPDPADHVLIVGDESPGELTITDHARVDSGHAIVGRASMITDLPGDDLITTVLVSDHGQWNVAGDMSLGDSSGDAQMTVRTGGEVTIADELELRSQRQITLDIETGGRVQASSVLMHGLGTPRSHINITGDNALLEVGDDLNVGTFGSGGVLTITDGAGAHADSLTVGNTGDVILDGGTLSAGTFEMHDTGVFEFLRGTLELGSDQTLSLGEPLHDVLANSSAALTGEQTLAITETLTLDTTLILDGGELRVGSLVHPARLDFQRGRFEMTDDELVIGSDGLFGHTLIADTHRTYAAATATVADDDGLLVLDRGHFHADTLTNHGEIALEGAGARLTGDTLVNHAALDGSGRIDAKLDNRDMGWINVNAGSLRFFGDENINAGTISAQNATLRFEHGLDNEGTLLIGLGTSQVFGDVANTGTIQLAGGGASFYDKLANQGSVEAGQGTTAVYLGEVTGTGTFEGDGTHRFEGAVSPGNSPGTLTVLGTAQLGEKARLVIELAADAYDQFVVTDLLELDGTLELELLDGFHPLLGDTFDILAFETLIGEFTGFDLPELSDDMDWYLDDLTTTGQISVIPEPGTAALMLASSVLLLRRRTSW